MTYSHQRIESLFSAALERADADDRQRFLNEACGGDATLRERVDMLLKSYDEAGDFLDQPAATWVPSDDVEDSEWLRRSVPAADQAALATPSNVDGETQAFQRRDHFPRDLSFLDPPTQPGTLGRLGGHEILETIGAGGMGIVLKARDTALHRVVAMKVLGPLLAVDSTARQRFLREAQAGAAVGHPHVVSIHAVQEANGLPFLVMEYVEGGTLQDKLEREGRLGHKDVVRIGLQIALGLAAAHQRGLIHRDVKPGNILLEDGEQVKITDFGLAHAADDVPLTRTGAVAGTPQFMSPEQAEGLPLSHHSDLFSFGVVMYAMCTGRSPFRAPSVPATLRAVCDAPARPVHEVNPEIPAWLSQLVGRLLAKDPAERHPSAVAVAEELRTQWLQLRQGDTSTAALRCTGACVSCQWGLMNLENLSSDTGAAAADAPPSAEVDTAVASGSNAWPLRARWLMAAGVAVAAAFLVWAGTMLLRTTDGEYLLETDDPQIAARLGADNGIVVHDLRTDRTYTLRGGVNRLPSGDYELVVTTPDGLELSTPQFRLNRGGRVAATVRVIKRALPTTTNLPAGIAQSSHLEPPEAAVAPFDAPRARQHQQAWAQYLNLRVADENSIDMELRLIPPGEFLMGAPDSDDEAQPGEKPQHQVTLTKPFWMGATEVTVGQYGKFVEATKYVTQAESDGGGAFVVSAEERSAENIWNKKWFAEPGNDSLPVTCVSWEDARHFCEWLSQKEGCVYRLPTDAEWEFACRAGTVTRYWFGDTFDSGQANANRQLLPVGQFAANPFGLFDTHGNVHELCLDAGRTFTSDAIIDPVGPEGDTVVVRGGALSSSPARLRSSQRYLDDRRKFPEVDFASPVKGFRVVREVPVPTGVAADGQPWSPGENLGPSINTPGTEWGPHLTADGLSLFFTSDQDRRTASGPLRIWQASRPSLDQPFGEAVMIELPLNQEPANLTDPTLSADGLVLAFCSNHPHGSIGAHDIWLCTRPSGDAPWSAAVNAGPGVNTDRDEYEPALSHDGLCLYFHAHRAGGQGGTDLWTSRRTNREEPFGPADNLGAAVNGPADEGGASLSADGLTLVFHRVAGDQPTLWQARRPAIDEPFGRAVPFARKSPPDARGPMLSPDGREFFFSASSGTQPPSIDLWRSRRIRPNVATPDAAGAAQQQPWPVTGPLDDSAEEQRTSKQPCYVPPRLQPGDSYQLAFVTN